ncbi:single-stranded DNA-binding protein, partial [Clostridium neonatale]
MINKSVFEGRVTKEPELKTVGEKRVVNTTIAVPRTKKDEADFIPVVIWG